MRGFRSLSFLAAVSGTVFVLCFCPDISGLEKSSRLKTGGDGVATEQQPRHEMLPSAETVYPDSVPIAALSPVRLPAAKNVYPQIEGGPAITETAVNLPDVDDVYRPRWVGTTVLHIGDESITTELQSGLLKHLLAAGSRYRVEIRANQNGKSWLDSNRLQRMLRRHEPDVVIVTFGLSRSSKKLNRELRWVKALAQALDDRTCYWLGSPTFRKDKKGMNELVGRQAKPCQYIDPRTLDLSGSSLKSSQSEKVLTLQQKRHIWADQIWLALNPSAELAQPVVRNRKKSRRGAPRPSQSLAVQQLGRE